MPDRHLYRLSLFSNQSSSESSTLSQSDEYRTFRSRYPQRRIVVDENSSQVWTYYDSGPKEITCPLICLPPVSGTADVFFLQVLRLHQQGYRVIAIHYPTYWTLREFVFGLIKLLDHLHVDKVHMFGASLGGFLAQKFAEQTAHCPRIESLILCNSFADTSIFNYTEAAQLFWMMPTMVLKKMIMGKNALEMPTTDETIKDSLRFMSERLDKLVQPELAARLTLNCMSSYVIPQSLQELNVTIIDVFDRCAISETVRDELHKFYPLARRAHLKTGGNFPYLSRADEVNMHILVHLRQFTGTKYDACLHS